MWFQVALAVINAAPEEIALIKSLLEALHPTVEPASIGTLKAAVDEKHAQGITIPELKAAVDQKHAAQQTTT